MPAIPADLRTGWFDWRRKRFWAWVLVALYTLFGYVIAPLIARGAVVDAVHDQLGVDATLDDVDIDPWALWVRLEGFHLADRSDAELFSFDELFVNLQLSSLFRLAWTFDEVRLVGPFLHVVRDAQGGSNLATLLAQAPIAQEEPEPESPPGEIVRVILHEVNLRGGKAQVDDHAPEPPFTTTLGPIDVTMRDLSTLPDEEGGQRIVITTEAGGRIVLTGELAMSPFSSQGRAEITGVPLAKVTSYLPTELALAVTEGKSDLSFDYTMQIADEKFAADIENLAFSINGLELIATDAEPRTLLELPSFRVTGGAVAWPARSVDLAEIAIDGAKIALWRDADQRFAWERGALATASSESEATAPPEETSPQGQAPSPDETPPPQQAPPPDAGDSAPWKVTVGRFAINESDVRFDDAGIAPPGAVHVTKINGAIEKLSLENDAEFPFKLAFALESGGELALDGALTAFPVPRVTTNVQVNGLQLAVAQPYIESFTYLDLESGAIDVAGNVTSTPEDLFTYAGKLAVNDLSVVHVGEERTRLLAWDAFALDGIALALGARRAEVANVRIDKPYARVHIAEGGTINVASVLKQPEPDGDETAQASEMEGEPEAAPTEPAQDWAVKVGRLRVADGETDYMDENLPIPFEIAMRGLAGDIGTIDSTSRAPAQMSLEGGVGEYGLAKIKGALAPLDVERNTTIDARFENISMPEASPYSIRFAGHKIASGKLDMRVEYEITRGRLKGDHSIVLRDFALGEKVEYPDALDLPYGLAISLLKGPDGNIDVDLPIEGDMNDPTFKLGGVIVKALVNLLTKIVTSPFNLLGKLVGLGDDEQLDNVRFEPGRSDLAPPEQERVSKLAQALAQRPQIKLAVHGVIDNDADARALKEAQVAARIEEEVAGGDQDTRRKVLERLVEERVPDIELDDVRESFTKAPAEGAKPVLDELEYMNDLTRRLVETEPLAPEALETLAAARAAAVRDTVVAGGEVDPSRIVLEATEAVSATEDGVEMKFELDAS
jgi:uncharacterized protein involved in outer membrane biogenesis